MIILQNYAYARTCAVTAAPYCP